MVECSLATEFNPNQRTQRRGNWHSVRIAYWQAPGIYLYISRPGYQKIPPVPLVGFMVSASPFAPICDP